MKVSEISFSNFRNICDTTINLDEKVLFFYGLNGQGKTNLLEALYFGITGKSFRTQNAKELIKYEKESFYVVINFNDYRGDKKLGILYKNSRKEYYLNGKKVDYDDFMGRINIVSFIPEDIEIINGTPSVRRNFFDYEISQTSIDYYNEIKEFEKVLKTRNILLREKKHKSEMFGIYNEKFIEIASKISFKRAEYIKNLSIILNLNYRKLFDEKSEMEIIYKKENFWKKSRTEIEEELERESLELREKELFCGYTLNGPQRDDFFFLLNGNDAKSFASQGEKKSIVFSMKIAELDMIFKEKKEYPVFLIDDIDSYFDPIRKSSIFSFMKKKNLQLFITSTHKSEIEAKYFEVSEGRLL